MEQERGITISELIENAKKTDKTILLIGVGIGMDAHTSRIVEQAERMMNGKEFIAINVGNCSIKEMMAHAQGLPKDRGIVIIEDIEDRLVRETREKMVIELRALDYDLKDAIILSDQKNNKDYGVSKNKKSFSPPKHKGYIQPKFVLRGKHR